jgi:hypothetical protein
VDVQGTALRALPVSIGGTSTQPPRSHPTSPSSLPPRSLTAPCCWNLAVSRSQAGNRWLMDLVAAWKITWDAAPPAARRTIGLEIYNLLTQEGENHARFLVRDTATGDWVLQERRASLAKIQRALKDCQLERPAPAAIPPPPDRLVRGALLPTDCLRGRGGAFLQVQSGEALIFT